MKSKAFDLLDWRKQKEFAYYCVSFPNTQEMLSALSQNNTIYVGGYTLTYAEYNSSYIYSTPTYTTGLVALTTTLGASDYWTFFTIVSPLAWFLLFASLTVSGFIIFLYESKYPKAATGSKFC